jgi:hypothetical protein
MKKIALAAFSATALFALSACGGDATTEEPVTEDTTVVEEAPMEEATDVTAEATDATDATDATAADAAATDAPVEEAPAE